MQRARPGGKSACHAATYYDPSSPRVTVSLRVPRVGYLLCSPRMTVRLYAMHIDRRNDNQLSVWALGANEQWALEHTANITRLLGRHHRDQCEFYILIAAHPERNLIFLTGGLRDELMSYDMDKQEVHTICSLQEYYLAPCLPYIPCFVEWSLPLHMPTES